MIPIKIEIKNKEKVYENIAKECFWDYHISKEDIKNIINSGSKREKQKLFSKIIYNSSDKLLSLSIFAKDDLEELLKNFTPTYNQKYITKHILILRSLILGEVHKIKGLEWKKR